MNAFSYASNNKEIIHILKIENRRRLANGLYNTYNLLKGVWWAFVPPPKRPPEASDILEIKSNGSGFFLGIINYMYINMTPLLGSQS